VKTRERLNDIAYAAGNLIALLLCIIILLILTPVAMVVGVIMMWAGAVEAFRREFPGGL
jgi:ABC-type sulfate transport system permease subunit